MSFNWWRKNSTQQREHSTHSHTCAHTNTHNLLSTSMEQCHGQSTVIIDSTIDSSNGTFCNVLVPMKSAYRRMHLQFIYTKKFLWTAQTSLLNAVGEYLSCWHFLIQILCIIPIDRVDTHTHSYTRALFPIILWNVCTASVLHNFEKESIFIDGKLEHGKHEKMRYFTAFSI